MIPEAAKTVAGTVLPEIEQEVAEEATREGKPLFRMWADVLQHYWSIPLWVLAGCEVWKLWYK